MAVFPRELAQYLADQLGAPWIYGKNVFLNALPQGRIAKIALRANGGEPAHKIVSVYSPYFKLQSQAETRSEALTNWYLAFNILNRIKDTNLTSYQVVLIEGLESTPRIVKEEANDFILEGDIRIIYKNLP